MTYQSPRLQGVVDSKPAAPAGEWRMAIRPLSEVTRHLRGLALQDAAGWTDGELVNAFAHQRDAVALAALIRRHGPMVWGVCRRLLGTHHDAEDAFQATFLVLVRKAAGLRNKEAVAN